MYLESKANCYRTLVDCSCIFLLEWVDGVWELEFTETEPLDAGIEAEIVQTGLSAFTELYSAMLPFATEKRDAAEVKERKKKNKLAISLLDVSGKPRYHLELGLFGMQCRRKEERCKECGSLTGMAS